MEYFNSAIKTKKNSDALNSIGCIYYRKNDLENAKKYFEKAMSNHGQNNLDVLEYKQDYPLVISPSRYELGLLPRDDRDYEDEYGHEEEENVKSGNKELERIYQNAKEYFYKAACRGHSDAIADNDVLLYVIERVNSDYCRNGLKSYAQLLANLQVQYEQQIQEQNQGQHGGYKQKYLKYKKKYIQLKN